MTALILHEYAPSGNCYKVRLTAAFLGLPLARRNYDILSGETRTPEFLTRVNGNGRIPVLQVGDRFLPESNAACCYLAHASPLMPSDRFEHADMLRWMFWEQYNHEPNIATLRFWHAFVGLGALSGEQRGAIAGKHAAGAAALRLMNDHLATRSHFVADTLSLADIALFAYTHVAAEGGFTLNDYPHVLRWIARIEARPGFAPMTG